MPPLRVLMLSWEYPPHIVGGLGSHVADLVPALARRGIEVTVVTPRWKGGPELGDLPAGGSVHRVSPPVAALGNFLADVQTCNVALQSVGDAVGRASGGFDLVHAHDWMVGFAAIALKHAHKTPLVATIHATERGRTGGGLASELNVAINGNEWWLTYEAWRVITTSLYMAYQVVDFFGAPRDKLDVVPNGVYTDLFDILPPRGADELATFRRRLASDHEPIVFHVGRLVGEKGAHVIVDAAPAVIASAPDAKFVIAGKGPLLDDLVTRVASLGLASRFYFTGFVPDDERDLLYRVADVAVFPSLYEPFGIVALEAMAALAPVVVAKVGGLAEVVEHNVTGLHVQPDDPASLAWGINHALAHPEWSQARADNAYRRLKQVFDWDLIAEHTEAVYRRVVAERVAADW